MKNQNNEQPKTTKKTGDDLFIELVGQKIGNYTVLTLDHVKEINTSVNDKPVVNRKAFYACKCDCGKVVLVRRETLLNPNEEKMCASCRKKKRQEALANDDNIIGHIFGDFKVISFDHVDNHGGYFYSCECIKCGHKNIKSRGSLLAERNCECSKCRTKYKSFKQMEYLIGKRFNKLIVIALDHRDEAKRINYYRCKCDCGQILIAKHTELLNGTRTACDYCQKQEYKIKMSQDLLGKKIGQLTVDSVSQLEPFITYKCTCECGEISYRSRKYLKSSPNPCCEKCAKINKYGDITDLLGKKIGKLTVLEIVDNPNTDQVYYKCKCDCGNEVNKIRRDLINNIRTSCGKCLRKEANYKALSDIIGKRFGNLTVLELSEKREDKSQRYYICQCDCGNIFEKSRRAILEGKEDDLKCSKCKTYDIVSDIIGYQFGNFIVEKFAYEKGNAKYYTCLCKLCNTEFIAERNRIKNGETKQCPNCTQRIKEEEFLRKVQEPLGKKYGKLTLLNAFRDSYSGEWYYNCRCDCGNIIQKKRYDIMHNNGLQCENCASQELLQKRINECIGLRFGRLTVENFAYLQPAPDYSENLIMYNCRCDCGNHIIASKKDLKHGVVKSCGCLKMENLGQIWDNNTIHGMSDGPLYQCYYDMIQRCYNPNNESFNDYGGRGIKVADEWLQPAPNGFLKFEEDMKGSFISFRQSHPTEKPTINRIDNNAGYSKENCQWDPVKVQNNNTRRNVFYNFEGHRYTVSQLIDNFAPNLTYDQLYNRVKAKYNPEDEIVDPEIFRNTNLESPISFIRKEDK